MHAKTSKEIIHATWYLQEKPVVAATLPSPSCSKSKVCHIPPKVLQENSKYPRV